jgi:hypothetical protein
LSSWNPGVLANSNLSARDPAQSVRCFRLTADGRTALFSLTLARFLLYRRLVESIINVPALRGAEIGLHAGATQEPRFSEAAAQAPPLKLSPL